MPDAIQSNRLSTPHLQHTMGSRQVTMSCIYFTSNYKYIQACLTSYAIPFYQSGWEPKKSLGPRHVIYAHVPYTYSFVKHDCLGKLSKFHRIYQPLTIWSSTPVMIITAGFVPIGITCSFLYTSSHLTCDGCSFSQTNTGALSSGKERTRHSLIWTCPPL